MTKGNILVADDEPEVLELCLRVLEREGYSVWGADQGREAVSLGKQHKYDLLLTDIHMPDITGLDVAQTIKQIDPDITCVTMTGFGTMDVAIEALKLGIDEFIVKPFGPNELIMAVNKALEKKRLQRENARLVALIPLFELNKTFMTTVDEQGLLHRVADIARQETKADRASLLLLRQENQDKTAFHTRVTSPETESSDSQQEIEAAVARRVVLSRAAVSYPESVDEVDPAGTSVGAVMSHVLQATPLLVKDRLIGVLVVTKERRDRGFGPSDRELLSVLGGQAAIAIENARLFEEIQRAYDELKELDRLKSEFINIAAHELRTPLAILLGYAGILKEEIAETQREYVQTILNNGMRLNSIIDDLLNLRNLETGHIELTVQEFSVADAINEALAELRLLIQDKHHSATADVQMGLPKARTDRRKFDLILFNLISNAVKFTPPSGRIHITGRQAGGFFEIAVADNGVGIAPGDIDRIFTRFYQTEHSLTREHGGMGLGLSIAKGMAEFLGGEIKVESEPGKGSRFTFTIPQA